jgi:hypothetical protein
MVHHLFDLFCEKDLLVRWIYKALRTLIWMFFDLAAYERERQRERRRTELADGGAEHFFSSVQ